MGLLNLVKDEVKERHKRAVYKSIELEYLGGLWNKKGNSIKFREHKNKYVTEIILGGNKELYEVKSIDWKERKESSTSKGIFGGFMGWLVGGIFGAVLGGMLGSRKKDKSKAVIKVQNESKEYNIIVRCNEKEFKKLNEIIYNKE